MATTNARRRLQVTSGPSDQLVGLLKALADTNRLRIIALLRQGEVCVCEMTDALHLPQNLVSHHLRILRESGLVTTRRDPNDCRWIYYSLNAVMLSALQGELKRILDPNGILTRIPVCDVRVDAADTSQSCRCK